MDGRKHNFMARILADEELRLTKNRLMAFSKNRSSLTKKSLMGEATSMSTFPQHFHTSLKAWRLRNNFRKNYQRLQCTCKVYLSEMKVQVLTFPLSIILFSFASSNVSFIPSQFPASSHIFCTGLPDSPAWAQLHF